MCAELVDEEFDALAELEALEELDELDESYELAGVAAVVVDVVLDDICEPDVETAADDCVAVTLDADAAPDAFSAIAVPSPRNALVLSTATTRRARQAGARRGDGRAVRGLAGCGVGGTGSIGMVTIVRPSPESALCRP